MDKKNSINFTGIIGEIIKPAQFPSENYLIDDKKYDSEGNWAFCRFTNEGIPAARFGFTRGEFDFSDFGGSSLPSYLQLHLEIMFREGAQLWIATGVYKAEMVTSDPEKMDIGLNAGGEEIFRISGWPSMKWHFRSDDDELEADFTFDLKICTILPDCILPHNVFSMWFASGCVSGIVRHKNKTTDVNGTVFYDHPRITVLKHEVTPRNWYIYTPMIFEDGSLLVSYYAEDATGKRMDYYSFGLYIHPDGASVRLPRAELFKLEFDEDVIPFKWALRWPRALPGFELHVQTENIKACKFRGSPGLPESRKDFVYIPLITNGTLSINNPDKMRMLTGSGLSEYWRMPGDFKVKKTVT